MADGLIKSLNKLANTCTCNSLLLNIIICPVFSTLTCNNSSWIAIRIINYIFYHKAITYKRLKPLKHSNKNHGNRKNNWCLIQIKYLSEVLCLWLVFFFTLHRQVYCCLLTKKQTTPDMYVFVLFSALNWIYNI